MMGGSSPTPARMRRSASSCSPRTPVDGLAGCRRLRSAAPAQGTWVGVNGVARSPEGVNVNPHASAKHWARDCGLR